MKTTTPETLRNVVIGQAPREAWTKVTFSFVVAACLPVLSVLLSWKPEYQILSAIVVFSTFLYWQFVYKNNRIVRTAFLLLNIVLVIVLLDLLFGLFPR